MPLSNIKIQRSRERSAKHEGVEANPERLARFEAYLVNNTPMFFKLLGV